MEKKWWVLISIAVIIILVGVITWFIKSPVEQEPYYKDNPQTWVDDKVGGVKEINVDKVTMGESYISSVGQYYDNFEIATGFDYNGWYKGNYFERDYLENGKKIMSIHPEMNPNDGVIEGFVLERIEGGVPYLYIFLDDDWRNKVNNTKVYVLQNESVFEFNNPISQGIYFTKLKDDPRRFGNDYSLVYGSIYVGDLKEEGSTVINFY